MDNNSSIDAVSTIEEEPLTENMSICGVCAISTTFFTIMYAVAAIAYPPMAIPPALIACITFGALHYTPGKGL